MKRFIYSTLIIMITIVLSACAKETAQPNTAVTDVFTPTPQVFKNTPVQTGVNDALESYSSDQLGLCFSYPHGYTPIRYDDSVEIAASDNPGSGMKGLFWIEMSDSYDRTAEQIANEEMTYAAGMNVGRWTVVLGGEPAFVLDGMPGQDLQRRVYVVHQQTLYILAFMPTRSENTEAAGQMEALYIAITNSWSWSPCSASE